MGRAKLSHVVRAVAGEPGRYWVDSHSFPGEWYIVDVLEVEPTNAGHIRGTCGCKGWQVRKTCSHLTDARLPRNHAFTALVYPSGWVSCHCSVCGFCQSDHDETKNAREPFPVPARPKHPENPNAVKLPCGNVCATGLSPTGPAFPGVVRPRG